MDKNTQRKLLKERINSFDKKNEAGQAIQKKLFELEEYKNSKSIFVYLNMPNEVSTNGIIKKSFENGKRIFVPIIREKMNLCEIFWDTEFEIKMYNILEPKKIVEPNIEIDIAIVPMVGFDKFKNRMGHGKGYYDKFLADFKGQKIGMAFAVQELEKIVVDKYDIKMDKIITEKQIF